MSDLPQINTIQLKEILSYLSSIGEVDWGNYKNSTLDRRVQARVQRLGLESMEQYLKLLKGNEAERTQLFQDLCIGFTSFFRDQEVFDALENFHLRELLLQKTRREIRIWIAGCSRGQEAYSIAMLLDQLKEETGSRRDYLIFASDIKPESLEYARKAQYSEEEIESIPKAFQQKYLTKIDQQFKITPRIRKKIVFTDHNLIQSTPFSRLDMVSCRNVLIYFKDHVQNSLIKKLHFSLANDGILILGKGENYESIPAYFSLEDESKGLFKKKERTSDFNNHENWQNPGNNLRMIDHLDKIDDGFWKQIPFQNLIYKFYSPAILIVDESLRLLHFTDNALSFIRLPNDLGQFYTLVDVASEAFADQVKLAIRAIKDRQHPKIVGSINMSESSDENAVVYTVEPFRARKSDEKLFTIILNDQPANPNSGANDNIQLELQDPVYINLLKDLEQTEMQLNHALAEVEQSRKDLITKNEELISSNEEFQSLNEELIRSNESNQKSIFNLKEQNNDLEFLLQVTEIGMIFLDSSERIQKFTSSVQHIFPLLESDLGRPFHHLTHNLEYPEMSKDIESVKNRRQVREKEVHQINGRRFLVRITPNLSKDGVFLGSVLCFIDISEKHETHQQTLLAAEKFTGLVEHSKLGILTVSETGGLINSNPKFGEITGWNKSDWSNKKLEAFIHPDDKAQFILEWYELIEQKSSEKELEIRFLTDHKNWRWVRLSFCPFYHPQKGNQFTRILTLIRDIHEQKTSYFKINTERKFYQTIFNENGVGIAVCKADGTFDHTNQAFLNLFGYAADELKLKHVSDLTDPSSAHETDKWINEKETQFTAIKKYLRKDGSTFWGRIQSTKIFDQSGQLKLQFGVLENIDELIKTTEALIESETRFRLITENTSNLITLLDEEFKFIYVSPNVTDLTGFTPFQLLHQSISRFFKAEEPDSINSLLSTLIKQNDLTKHQFTISFNGEDGQQRWLETQAILVLKPDESLNFIQLISTDVTEKLKADQALKLSEKRFRNIFHHSGSFICYLDRQGTIIDVNNTMSLRLQKTREELIGQLIFNAIDEVDNTDSKAAFIAALDGEFTKVVGQINVSETDQPIFEVSLNPVMDEHNNQTEYIVAEGREITEKVLALTELKESKQFIDLITQYYPQSVIVFNVNEEGIIYHNIDDGFLGYSHTEWEELRKGLMVDIIHPEDVEYLKDTLFRNFEKIQEKDVITTQIRAKTKEGKWRYFSCTIFLFNQDAEEHGKTLMMVATDVTEQEKSKTIVQHQMDELNQKNEELEKYIDSNLELENFAYITSHDLREPLRNIGGFTQLLERRYSHLFDEKAEEYMGFIKNSTAHMNQLIEDILEFSRINSEAMRRDPVKLEIILLRVEHNLREKIQQSNASIQYDNIPDSILGHPTRLFQLFNNLINNAIKFQKPDEKPVVNIKCEESETHWHFSISDNGIGIDPEYSEKIFLLFKRLHTRESFKGSGIGLSICRKVVQQHGGKIWQESNESGGSTFYFTISKLPELSK